MPENIKDSKRLILLYIPWLLSVLFSDDPVLSYFTAWSGSFYIFFMTLTGRIRTLPQDRRISEQLMRPIFIVQVIFAGYMCCTSVFYFLDLMNNGILALDGLAPDTDLRITAQCQRYYCLGHAAFVTGIMWFMDYPVRSRYLIETQDLAGLLLTTAVIALPVSFIFLATPGLSQFYFQLSALSFIAGTLALAFAIPRQKLGNIAVCLVLYAFNFYQALLSGFKEPIIISVLVLGVFLYPNYKRIVAVVFVPAMFLLFIYLPIYVGTMRQSAWSGEKTAEAASQLALDAAINQDPDNDTTWQFLVYRFSEIGFFTQYVKTTPDPVGFYGFDLIEQSLIAIVPRIFWPSKPSTESIVMERVYRSGVVYRGSNVSAKPQFIVDAYLSYGAIGVIIALFTYGAVAQLIAIKAEQLFGGYILGTALVFSGLFQIFWRGLSFEFIVNSVFWSFVTMLVLFKILRSTQILKDA